MLSIQDTSLKRCFGKEEKIIDCNWSYLKTLRTLKTPHQAMPRLKDLLEYLTTPGLEDIWILLDIKVGEVRPLLRKSQLMVQAGQRCRRYYKACCQYAGRSEPISPMGAESPFRMLGGFISSYLCTLLTKLFNNAYRLQHIIRTAVFEATRSFFQYVSENHGRTIWKCISP